MKETKRTSLPILKPLLLLACLAAVSASVAGPTNSWSDWRYKKLLCGFTNSLLVTLNGHALPMFSPELFDGKTHVYLYGDTDGDVFGAGDMSLKTADRDAIFNVEVDGSLTTKGSVPYLTFKLSGEGGGTAGTQTGEAELDAKYVQTNFLTFPPGGSMGEVYYSEGKITGTIKQEGADSLKFEDDIRIALDNIPGHLGDIGVIPQLRLDIVNVGGRRFAGHAHGTNNCFGRYAGAPDDVVVKGTYKASSGDISMDVRGLGAARSIKATVTGQLGSDEVLPGDIVRIPLTDVTMKVKAYGQKTEWTGNGTVQQTEP